MADPVSICNVALSRIGVNAFISALNEATAEAEACNVLYPHNRDSLLGKFPWPFAIRREALARLANVSRSGWAYAYSLPADYLRALYLWAGVRNPRLDQMIPYQIESEAGKPILLTDEPAPELVYVFKNTDVSVYPPAFQDALVWALAADLAVTLAVRADLEQRARKLYEIELQRAATLSLSEAMPDQEPESSIITSRR